MAEGAEDLARVPTDRLIAIALGRVAAQPEDAMGVSAKDAQIPTGLERFGRGQMDFYQGVKQKALNWTDPQAAQDYTANVNADLSRYGAGRQREAQQEGESKPGFDWLRAMGGAATPLAAAPGGGASVLPRIALGGAAGAGGGYAMFNPANTESSNLLSAGLGFGIGGVANVAAPAIAGGLIKGAQWVGNQAREGARSVGQMLTPQTEIVNNVRITLQNQGVDFGRLSNAAQTAILEDARNQLRVAGQLNPEQLLRRADIEAIAGPGSGTLAQVTRDPAQWTRERNLQKTEMNLPTIQNGEVPSITNRYQTQDAAMRGRAGEIVDTLHTDPVTLRSVDPAARAESGFQASERTARVIRGRSEELQGAVSEQYNLARNAFGAHADLPRDRFAATAMRVLDEYEDVIPSPIVRRLQEFGIERMGVSNPRKAFTVQEGDELLKLINQRSKTADASTGAALGELRNALKGAVDELGQGGNPAAQNFRQAWAQASERFRELEQPNVRRLLDETIDTSRFLENRVLKGNPNELVSLRETVLRGPEGRQVWNDLRGQAWQWAVDKATQQGHQPFSGAKFDSALNQIGVDRMRVLFTPQEIQQIAQLRRGSMAMTMEPGFAAPNRSNTAPALLGQLLQLGNRIPFANMVTKPMQEQIESSTTQRLITQALNSGGANTAARDAAQAATRQRATGLLFGPAWPGLLGPAAVQQNR